MLNNIELFNECLQNRVPNIDRIAREALNKKIIPFEKDDYSELLARNYELVELLQEYNNLNVHGDFSRNVEIISKIDECLKYEGMNLCPFSQYLMVHDLTYDIYLKELSFDEKKYIIDCYIEDRHQMYLNHDYSNIIFQVMNDNYSHKRKTVIGVEKIKRACQDNNISHFDGNFDAETFYLLPDSGGKELFKQALQKYHIRFEFAGAHQDKMPDAFIKYNNVFIIVEHKKMKSTGGGQDKQITEIIDFIKYGERDVYYVSYLDGILFNQLIDPPRRRKIFRSKQDILNHLQNNPYNYFVNEYGFNKLLNNISNNNK